MKQSTDITFFVVVAMAGATLAGCAVGPNYKPPKVELGPRFGEFANTNTNPSRPSESPPAVEWWRGFNDPELNRLIAAALRENYNLRVTAERIRESRFQRSIIAADLFPNINADGGYFRGRGSKNVVLQLSGTGGGSSGGGSSAGKGAGSGSSGSDPPGDPPGPGGGSTSSGSAGSTTQVGANPFGNVLTPFGQGGLPGVTSSLYQVGFDSTWELDVFGGNRRRLEAAAADLSAAVETLRDVSVSLMAEVAMDYLELRGTQQRLAIARTNLASQNETLRLTESRANAGLTSRADVTRAAAQAAITAATIPPLETSARRSIHALSTLIAQEPTALSGELSSEQPLPVVPPEVPVGLPSELLQRRPDIRRAERQIAAATARVGSAKADLFPKFALTGNVGFDSTSPGNLFNWESRYFLISPTVTWRIFDAGRIVSNIALQKANQQESVLQYRGTILTALQEVEDALVGYGEEQTHHAALAKALDQTEESFQLVRQQYEHGLATFLDVLDAQRNVLSAQDQLAQSGQAITTDLVALYKALGGGWQIQNPQKNGPGNIPGP
ncbi:MAG: transcriptional regulator, Fis family [Pedosphaera sp.]|nr:transcriptional regulator, Fis family [Pedosphaera sp.]